MTKIYEAADTAGVSLPTGAWDVGSFLENAKSTVQGWGGGVLMLLGVIALIVGAVFLVKKLLANPQTAGQQHGWATIALLIIVGGALGTGGFQLVKTVGSGGEKTIKDLGDGAVIVQTADHADQVNGVLPIEAED